jgi:potassium efflux system protein
MRLIELDRIQGIAGLVLATALLALACVRNDPIQLAFAGPLTGPSAADGQSAANAIQLVLDEVNAKGGVNGRHLELAPYDDANDPDRALDIARALAADPTILAVIGHSTSPCSIAAGRIYAAAGLPAVTAASSNVAVTAGNPFYFRVLYNDRDQGRAVVSYVSAIFREERFAIVHESDSYGSYLASVMQEAAPQVGVQVDRVWPVDGGASDVTDRLDTIVTQIVRDLDSPVVVVATQRAAANGLVQRLRDADYPGRILVPGASEAMADDFRHLPKERAQPGFYTQGMFTSTPFLFDTGGRAAGDFVRRYTREFGSPPDWYAAFAADATSTIVEALRRGGIEPSVKTLKDDRVALRDALAAIGPYAPVAGITGETWFDASGDAEKRIPIGRFLNGDIVSAFAQLEPLPPGLDDSDEARLVKERIFVVGDERLYRTDVARVGVRALRFPVLALDEGEFEMEFDLWFRHAGDASVEDIVFNNALEPVVLGEPIDAWERDGLTYRRYRTAGRFRADILAPPYGERVLGLSMQHRSRSRDELVLAIDRLGMNLGRSSGQADRGARARNLLDAGSGWALRDLVYFEDERAVPGFGHPAYLSHAHSTRPISELTVALFVERSGFSLRSVLATDSPLTVFGVSLVASLLLLWFGRGDHSSLRFVLQALFALTLLAAIEPMAAEVAGSSAAGLRGGGVRHLFDTLWWIVPALLMNVAIARFLWRPAEERSGNPIPSLLRWSVSFLVILIAVFGVIAFVYDYRLTGLLATSGVLAMIIGLAVQLNITNIFAGVALNLERPFRVGDWIMIHGRTPSPDNGVIGQVIDINWRTTRLCTTDNTEIVIPNGQISEKTITNFMHPSELSRFELDFVVDQSHSPDEVIALIKDALGSVLGSENKGPVADPAPSVRIKETTERGIVYQVRYRLIPREVSPAKGRHTINEAVLRSLREHGIELAYQRRDVYEHRVDGG